MNTKLGLLLSSLLLILACQTEPAQEQSFVHAEVPEQLSLNNGNKWNANPETVQGIEQMNQIIEDVEAASAKELHQALSHELQFIFKECTMKGESHEQLHHYLIPLRDYINQLEKSNEDEARKLAQKIQAHLQLFHEYFE